MVKIFYDGADIIEKRDDLKNSSAKIEGYTTNSTFVAKHLEKKISPFVDSQYENYAKTILMEIGNKPISFQVISESIEDIEKDARQISSWGKNVYVKIPVVTPSGDSTVDLIRKLHGEGMKINVTTVYTHEQIQSLSGIFGDTPVIVSVFAGGLSDCGIDPTNNMKYAVKTFAGKDNVEILWAGCQRLLSIREAEWCGCDIVTVPWDVLRKHDRLDTNAHDACVAKSKLFYDDAEDLALTHKK
jgi:transaldolase